LRTVVVQGKSLLDPAFSESRAVQTFQVNSIALMWTVRAFLPSMLSRNHGHIVTVASMAGHCGQAGLVDYCGSKFAAVGIDESVRQLIRAEHKSGVHTTCVCPYYINTGMFDGVSAPWYVNLLMPIMQPEYVVEQMVGAIRRNEPMLLLPPFANLAPLLKPLLPTGAYDFILDDVLQMNKTMQHFKGNNASFQRS
jgi:all-trans-retinol dehydrogenase (NAD+)